MERQKRAVVAALQAGCGAARRAARGIDQSLRIGGKQARLPRQKGNMKVTCPECESSNVVQQMCGAFGWLECLDCHHRWDDDAEPKPKRKVVVEEKGDTWGVT
jgi:hypothetical protein